VARELNLVFPSSMATAITIHNMHSAANGDSHSDRKLPAMLYAFGAAIALRVASQYALGLLWVGERLEAYKTIRKLLSLPSSNITNNFGP
jgi:hypothetical protein